MPMEAIEMCSETGREKERNNDKYKIKTTSSINLTSNGNPIAVISINNK